MDNTILLTNLVHIVYIFTGCANPNYSRIQTFLKHFEWLYIFDFLTNTDEDFFKSLLLLHESDERINKVVPFVPEMFIHQYIGHVHRTVWGPKLWSLLHGLAAQKNTTPVVVDQVLHNLSLDPKWLKWHHPISSQCRLINYYRLVREGDQLTPWKS